MNDPIWPKIELALDFMDVLITCKNEEDPIKNETAIDRPTFPHCKSMGAKFSSLKGKYLQTE